MLCSGHLAYGLRVNTGVCVFKSTVFVGKDPTLKDGPNTAYAVKSRKRLYPQEVVFAGEPKASPSQITNFKTAF